MIPAPTHVWLVVEPIDMRTGIDGLSQRIQNTLGRSPCDGSAYAFHNQRRTRIKLLVWDGTGVWLCHRRLHRGHFLWPSSDATTCTLTAKQWEWLITGVDWQRLEAPPPAHWRV
jgi:transposase